MDASGQIWETPFDIITLAISVVEVIIDPYDPLNWAGLAADAVALIPFVTGVGEATRVVKVTSSVIETADTVYDAGKVVNKIDDVSDVVVKNTKNARRNAVRKAWQNEVSLVQSTGRGTRNWKAMEIDELLTTGKVKGYVGHHMKSVKGYPNLAGDPRNIQFLTRQEHFAAHGRNWRNITHGRYVP